MEADTFFDKVTKHFGYLETEFGFRIILASSSDIRPETDGLVKYSSNTTVVIIGSETGQVSIRLVRVQDDEKYYIDPVSIHEYLNTNEEEKRILLSTDVKDQSAATAVFNKTFLLSSSAWKKSGENLYFDLDRQLINYADWLRSNANLCISGDFSQWPYLYEYKIDRLIADELRRGGKATVFAVIKDENGVLKTIQRPIFSREKDHAAKLKKEILRK